jgi:hypothetical protein
VAVDLKVLTSLSAKTTVLADEAGVLEVSLIMRAVQVHVQEDSRTFKIFGMARQNGQFLLRPVTPPQLHT